MKRETRNCRCCLASYTKPEDYWCKSPTVDDKGKIIKPVGFCEFCDRNNDIWYIPELACHSKVK